MSVERVLETDDLAVEGPGAVAEDQPADDRRRRSRRRSARTSPSACPTTAATRRSSRSTRRARRRRKRGTPGGRSTSTAAATTSTGRSWGCERRRRDEGPRDPGRVLRDRGGRVLPRRRRDHGQPDRHDPDDRRPARPGELRARPRDDRRRGDCSSPAPYPISATDQPKVVEAWNPYRSMFDVVWSGRRHVMMGASQIDRYGNQNFAFIGSWEQPKAQLLGFRGAPGNTIQNTTSYWIPNHSPKVFVEKVDVVSGVGLRPRRGARPGRALPQPPPRRHEPRRPRLRDAGPHDAPPLGAPGRDGRRDRRRDRLRARRPRRPCPRPGRRRAEEYRLIHEVLDPTGLREQEVPNP